MVHHSRWYVNVTKWVPTRDEWLKLTSSIARDDLERINKFYFREDSKSSLIGCALIRKFLAQATRIASNEIVLTKNQHGRPEVCKEFVAKQRCWPPLLDFNVSHSGDYCVLAGITSDRQQMDMTVGVDVTKIVSKKSTEELADFLSKMSRREFNKSEWQAVVEATSDRQKCINFTRLWCLKESYIKSIGLGLTFKLSRIDFRLSERYRYNITTDILKNTMICDTRVLLDGVLATDWRFCETALDDEHIVALGYNMLGQSFNDQDHESYLNGSQFEEVSVDAIVNSLSPINEADETNWTLFSGRSFKSAN